MQVESKLPQVAYGELLRADTATNRHRFLMVEVGGITEDNNRVRVEVAQFGLKRITSLRPRAIEVPFNVVWNGDRLHPELVFDGWVDTGRVEIEVWGN